MIGTYADLTCGEACWAARLDVCRCSCSGANHGITRSATGERPTRTRTKDYGRYRLAAVGSSSRARSISHELTWRDGYPYGRCYFDSFEQSAAKHQRKWPEFANSGISHPYGVWVREHMPQETVDAAIARTEQQEAEKAVARRARHAWEAEDAEVAAAS